MELVYKLLGKPRPTWLTDGLYYSNVGFVFYSNNVSYTATFFPFLFKWGRCEGDKLNGLAPGLWCGPFLFMVQRH